MRRQIRQATKFDELILARLRRDVIDVDLERMRQLTTTKKHKTQLYLHQWDATYRYVGAVYLSLHFCYIV